MPQSTTSLLLLLLLSNHQFLFSVVTTALPSIHMQLQVPRYLSPSIVITQPLIFPGICNEGAASASLPCPFYVALMSCISASKAWQLQIAARSQKALSLLPSKISPVAFCKKIRSPRTPSFGL